MRLVLVRHGESICSVNGIVGGSRGCTGLTERGFDQARSLRDRLTRERFSADVLLTSTLPRASDTAETIGPALGLDPTHDAELVEFQPGEIDGTPWESFDGFDVVAEPDRPLSPGGESLSQFRGRVRGLLERLAATHDGRTVVAVCHGGVIGSSLSLGFGATLAFLPVDIDFTSITEWRRDNGSWHLARFNDVAHLRGTDLLD